MSNHLHLTNLIKLLENSDLSFKSQFFMMSSDYRFPRIDCGAREDWVLNDSNFEEFFDATGTIKSTFDVEVFKRLVASNDFFNDITYNDCYCINLTANGKVKTKYPPSDQRDWSLNSDTYDFVRHCVNEYYCSDFYYNNPAVNKICEDVLSDDEYSDTWRMFYANESVCSPLTSAIVAQFPYIDLFTHFNRNKNPSYALTKTNNDNILYDVKGTILKDYGMKYMEVSRIGFYKRDALKSSEVFHKIIIKRDHVIDNSVDRYMKLWGYNRSLSNVSNSKLLTPKAHNMSVEESKAYIQLYKDAMVLRFRELIRIYGEDLTLNDLQIMKNVYSKRKMESAHIVSNLLNCEKMKEMVLGLHEMTTLKNEVSGEPLYRYPWNMYI